MHFWVNHDLGIKITSVKILLEKIENKQNDCKHFDFLFTKLPRILTTVF